MLSLITFKFTVSNSLPKVSYMTSMDKYIIGVMAQLCLVGVWHGGIGQYSRNTAVGDTERVDKYILADRIALGLSLFQFNRYIKMTRCSPTDCIFVGILKHLTGTY